MSTKDKYMPLPMGAHQARGQKDATEASSRRAQSRTKRGIGIEGAEVISKRTVVGIAHSLAGRRRGQIGDIERSKVDLALALKC